MSLISVTEEKFVLVKTSSLGNSAEGVRGIIMVGCYVLYGGYDNQ